MSLTKSLEINFSVNVLVPKIPIMKYVLVQIQFLLFLNLIKWGHVIVIIGMYEYNTCTCREYTSYVRANWQWSFQNTNFLWTLFLIHVMVIRESHIERWHLYQHRMLGLWRRIVLLSGSVQSVSSRNRLQSSLSYRRLQTSADSRRISSILEVALQQKTKQIFNYLIIILEVNFTCKWLIKLILQ